MNEFIKKILISSILLFGFWVLFLPSTFALANNNLIVQFEKTPLFSETNFVPGDSVTRWIKVTNNSGETKRIGIKAENYSSGTNDLSNILLIEIKEGVKVLYPTTTPTTTLFQFYQAGGVYLSELPNGSTTQYDLTVYFPTGAGDDWQLKTTTFDILVGFEAEAEGGEPGGTTFRVLGGEIVRLYIFNENLSTIGGDSVVITWETNLPASSRVIFSAFYEPHTFDPTNSPNYGYSHSTIEDPSQVTFHSVTLTGLLPATTYYFRCVSTNPTQYAISSELTFTTKAVAGATFEQAPSGEIPPPTEELPSPQEAGEIKPAVEGVEEIIKEKPGFLATVSNFFNQNICWALFSLIIIFVILLLITKKREEKFLEWLKKKWFLIFVLIILIILYCYFCCTNCFFCCKNCWILIFIVIALFVLFSLFKRK